MPLYEIYAIGKEGHIVGQPDVVEMPNDMAAVVEAQKRLADLELRILQDGRVVAHLVP